MPTPRSESIAKARSGDVLPISRPDEAGQAKSKADHYAALGVIMKETFTRYVGSAEARESLARSRSVGELGETFSDALIAHMHAAASSPEFSAVHAALAQSQLDRGRADTSLTTRLEFILDDGARNFAAVAESVYDVAAYEFSPALARMPGTASVVDRLAKLNIAQFAAYGTQFVFDGTRRRAFASHLVADGTGVRFKPGFPQAALVPAVLAQNGGIYTNSDLALDNPDVIAVGHIQTDRPTVGCPITFYKGQVPELWDIYSSARASLQTRFDLGREAAKLTASPDGTAASSQATT